MKCSLNLRTWLMTILLNAVGIRMTMSASLSQSQAKHQNLKELVFFQFDFEEYMSKYNNIEQRQVFNPSKWTTLPPIFDFSQVFIDCQKQEKSFNSSTQLILFGNESPDSVLSLLRTDNLPDLQQSQILFSFTAYGIDWVNRDRNFFSVTMNGQSLFYVTTSEPDYQINQQSFSNFYHQNNSCMSNAVSDYKFVQQYAISQGQNQLILSGTSYGVETLQIIYQNPCPSSFVSADLMECVLRCKDNDLASVMSLEYSNLCVLTCPTGQYKDSQLASCRVCNNICLSCVGPLAANCTACAQNYVMQKGGCVNSMVVANELFLQQTPDLSIVMTCNESVFLIEQIAQIMNNSQSTTCLWGDGCALSFNFKNQMTLQTNIGLNYIQFNCIDGANSASLTESSRILTSFSVLMEIAYFFSKDQLKFMLSIAQNMFDALSGQANFTSQYIEPFFMFQDALITYQKYALFIGFPNEIFTTYYTKSEDNAYFASDKNFFWSKLQDMFQLCVLANLQDAIRNGSFAIQSSQQANISNIITQQNNSVNATNLTDYSSNSSNITNNGTIINNISNSSNVSNYYNNSTTDANDTNNGTNNDTSNDANNNTSNDTSNDEYDLNSTAPIIEVIPYLINNGYNNIWFAIQIVNMSLLLEPNSSKPLDVLESLSAMAAILHKQKKNLFHQFIQFQLPSQVIQPFQNEYALLYVVVLSADYAVYNEKLGNMSQIGGIYLFAQQEKNNILTQIQTNLAKSEIEMGIRIPINPSQAPPMKQGQYLSCAYWNDTLQDVVFDKYSTVVSVDDFDLTAQMQITGLFKATIRQSSTSSSSILTVNNYQYVFIVCGVLAFLVFVALAIYFIFRRRRNKKKQKLQSLQAQNMLKNEDNTLEGRQNLASGDVAISMNNDRQELRLQSASKKQYLKNAPSFDSPILSSQNILFQNPNSTEQKQLYSSQNQNQNQKKKRRFSFDDTNTVIHTNLLHPNGITVDQFIRPELRSNDYSLDSNFSNTLQKTLFQTNNQQQYKMKQMISHFPLANANDNIANNNNQAKSIKSSLEKKINSCELMPLKGDMMLDHQQSQQIHMQQQQNNNYTNNTNNTLKMLLGGEDEEERTKAFEEFIKKMKKVQKGFVFEIVSPQEYNPDQEGQICVLESIGHGSYGHVFKAKCTKNREPRVLKIFKKRLGIYAIQEFAIEMQNLRKVNHENIIRLYGIAYNFKKQQYGIVEELMHMTLSDIVAHDSNVPFSAKVRIAQKLINGIQYLHEIIQRVHRDLKPQNVFIDNDFKQVKIGDLGTLSSELMDQNRKRNRIHAFTISYAPPEYILCYYCGIHFTEAFANDIWSLGIILYELFYGERADFVPWLQEKINDIPPERMQQIIQKCKEENKDLAEYNQQKVPKIITDVINKCLRIDPTQRLSISQLSDIFESKDVAQLVSMQSSQQLSSKNQSAQQIL